jgi:hypothetical protein
LFFGGKCMNKSTFHFTNQMSIHISIGQQSLAQTNRFHFFLTINLHAQMNTNVTYDKLQE